MTCPAVPSLALGSGEVTLLDLTAAYGTFAAGGMLNTPVLIRRVEDAEGTVIFTSEPHAEQAVTPQTAFLMASMLADVINSGTAWKARQLGFKLPAGGKTGHDERLPRCVVRRLHAVARQRRLGRARHARADPARQRLRGRRRRAAVGRLHEVRHRQRQGRVDTDAPQTSSR